MRATLVFIACTIVLAGCAGYAPSGGQTNDWVDAGCKILDVKPCDDKDLNAPKLELDLDAWTLKPECVKAKKGGEITITLKSSGAIEEGSVVVFPKKVENYFWLAKTNSPNKNKIKIKVKKKNPSGKELEPKIYEYAIYTGEKCLDPRVDVKN